MKRRLLVFAQPAGLIAYTGIQWLLFLYFIHRGGLALGGDFALAQAIIAPVFGLLSFSLRQVWVTRGTGGMDYGGLVLVRLATTCLAILAVLAATQAIGLRLHPAPFLLVLLLKSQEALADILYARLDTERRSALAGLLLMLKGGVLGLAIVAALVASLPLVTAAIIIGATAVTVLILEAAIVLSLGERKPVDLRRSVAAIGPALRPIAWLSAANLVITVAGFLPRYALEIFGSREAVGLFTAIAMPASVMLLICTGLAQAYLHDLSRTVEDRASHFFLDLLRRLGALILALVCAAAVALNLAGPAVLAMFGKAVDPDAVHAMVAVLFIFLPSYAAQVLSYIFLALRTYRRLVAINAAGLVAQILLAWPLIRLDPVYGAALLTITVSLVQTAAFTILLVRHFRHGPRDAEGPPQEAAVLATLNDL